jgi:hypothetical protein
MFPKQYKVNKMEVVCVSRNNIHYTALTLFIQMEIKKPSLRSYVSQNQLLAKYIFCCLLQRDLK